VNVVTASQARHVDNVVMVHAAGHVFHIVECNETRARCLVEMIDEVGTIAPNRGRWTRGPSIATFPATVRAAKDRQPAKWAHLASIGHDASVGAS